MQNHSQTQSVSQRDKALSQSAQNQSTKSHSALAPNLLQLILMPTERCNFRCTYCYEDFDLGRMSSETTMGIEKLLKRRAPELDRLLVDWFGGEPLLAPDVIEEVQQSVLALAGRYPRLSWSCSMTTNGYLLDAERLSQLLEMGVSQYQISVDGLGKYHDRRRPRADGAGTFNRIWSNLKAARALDLDYQIKVRVNLDPDSQQGFEDFLDEYQKTFGSDPRFILFVRGIARLGGPNDANLEVFEGEKGARSIAELRDVVEGQGLQHDSEPGQQSFCYAAAANSFVIRSNGDVAKCTVALRHANNRVGRLLPDGSLELDNAKMLGWIRGIWSGDRDELDCPMVGYADSPTESSMLPIVV